MSSSIHPVSGVIHGLTLVNTNHRRSSVTPVGSWGHQGGHLMHLKVVSESGMSSDCQKQGGKSKEQLAIQVRCFQCSFPNSFLLIPRGTESQPKWHIGLSEHGSSYVFMFWPL